MYACMHICDALIYKFVANDAVKFGLLFNTKCTVPMLFSVGNTTQNEVQEQSHMKTNSDMMVMVKSCHSGNWCAALAIHTLAIKGFH